MGSFDGGPVFVYSGLIFLSTHMQFIRLNLIQSIAIITILDCMDFRDDLLF